MKNIAVKKLVPVKISALFAILLFLQPAFPAMAETPYNNPVIGNPKQIEGEVPDPYVLKWNGEYYLYTSGDPITAYHSTDLVHWDSIGPVLSSSAKKEAWNQADIWAPEVVYRNGKFYMYYTGSKKSDDWRVGEMARRIGVAISDSPRGPFIDSGNPVTPGWGIDATIFKDPDGGNEYMFYSYLYEPRLPGAGIVADRMTSWNSVTGKISHITRGTEAWEDKDGDPNNGGLRYTNEGPTVFKRHGIYYMMYSGGSWDLPTYSLGYATSDKVIQGGLEGPGWKKVIPPFLRSTPLVDGPGHNALVKAPNNVDDIVIYHARTVPFIEPWNRLPFVDRLYWNHDNMFMQQPSLGDMANPDRPLFSDNFNNLDNMWQRTGGNWNIVSGQLRQNSTTNAMAIPRCEKLSDYVFEANIKAVNGNFNFNSAIGVSAYYLNAENYVDVWLNPLKKSLISSGKLNGEDIAEQLVSLPADFKFDTYHQLIVTKNANQISTVLDGVNMQSRTFSIDGTTPATVALKTLDMQADFDGIAITPYYEDTFDTPMVSWEQKSGTWLSEEGALDQVDGTKGKSIALKGQPAENYEFTASLKLRDNESINSKTGVVAAFTNDKMVIGGFDKTIWPQARFWVQYFEKNNLKQSFGVGLPRGFDYNAYHTIRTVKQGNGFTFFLDGREIAASRFDVGIAKPGLFTEDARAAFDDATMKRLIVSQNLLLNPGFETEQWDGSSASKDNPWILSGSARVNDCCAHSGYKRLIIHGDSGTAKQEVTGLTPGHYKVSVWFNSTGNNISQLSVSDFGGSTIKTSAKGENWSKATTDFIIPKGKSSATISFSSDIKSGSNSLVAIDDFYLAKIN